MKQKETTMNYRIVRTLSAAALVACLFVSCADVKSAPLPPGVPVATAGDPSALTFFSPGSQAATSQTISVDKEPFAKALHVETLAPTPNPWDVQVLSNTTASVKKGDTLLLTFYVRALTPSDGSAHIGVGFEQGSAPYLKSLDVSLTPLSAWTRVDLPFQSLETYAPGTAHFHVTFGFKRQTIEVGDFALTDYGPNVAPADLPHAP